MKPITTDAQDGDSVQASNAFHHRKWRQQHEAAQEDLTSSDELADPCEDDAIQFPNDHFIDEEVYSDND